MEGAGDTSVTSPAASGGEPDGSQQARSNAAEGAGTAAATASGGAGENGGSGSGDQVVPAEPGDSEAPLTRFVTSVPDELMLALALAVALALGAGLALLRERRRSRDARETALRDPLTQLANRVAFDQQLAIEWERFQRHGRPFGVLALDLDRLKEVNDRHGHSAGDRVLREAGRAIQGRVRQTDFAARMGGDEFCVIAPEPGEQGLASLAATLREAVEADGNAISVGWALASAEEGPIQLLHRADAAMYEDKRSRSAAPSTPLRVGAPIAT
jgi:diguanylate cyclase (GGDEF)-like protein